MESAVARSLVHELSVINFRYQLLAVDEMADQTVPKPSAGLSVAELEVQRVKHRESRLALVDAIFAGGCTFTTSEALFTHGIASHVWSQRLVALRAFWKIMTTWPGEKEKVWDRGANEKLDELAGAGMEWEESLIRFYVQTYYNFLGHPPVLPRRR
ncbi:hypothetical protein V5O48_017843 [Marasmius crinis-equi]|uniref:Uncharacterized protein n=1 Tax=Marasmius crinis-equi TaxID=585013 RepID=A0ABR3EMU5_9AGAR